MNKDKTVELLLPAGGLDTLICAVDYGADAVYIGGQRFGLRAKADNFSIEDMKKGVEYAHAHGAKVYLTVNIFAHNNDIHDISSIRVNLKIHKAKPFDYELIILLTYGLKC